ncbi:DegT/DnrJ/EryC1/StrS family aminotransferase [Clostridium botulinum]|uniref:Nucleotide sugar transaminase n=1 Tax=Clostridium botulinum (strain Hall / ATCC 3502 / NCTC 13319 / Type A) TaxID=441771 RepID=A5I3H4_CLOBH|nr:DegT/DnrJ/EryC1/StrS family aminotransferase [Clostridium botulinum]EPS49172.1 aminotransferase [Clostridium botulinum CFSAN002369]ABS33470.1 aminotransferase, DegT/DnrJ/EryC1/StrS family [Clostridium botulinum A str. ATCC 19397]ABS38028.1 aminotransferase, DegT/DnrJ/EryC1/StrS family [Clostridium botulinum A str. Hall]APU60948.1 beta-eliminating lyase family protein [Clostridium botulinum]AWB17920.1 DegT/DnrJ/EryC1/StrS family aminotransferase [Clostridium botulinum]
MTAERFTKPFYITQPLLPDINQMNEMIKEIWESNQLSNNGNMVKQLERDLSNFLNTDYLSVFANGTTALQLACKVLRLSGEVITTPFTFAATVHSLPWNNIKPIFCDIEEDTFNINPDLIESLITQDTTAIMPVHVFGTPCNVEKIQRIADKHGLKVLYDAAHAFGVEIDGKPISSFGDISMFSFHATKIYHTIEGGALTFKDAYSKERADSLRNFGIQGIDNITELGTNGKLNEVQAAVGILLLKMVEDEIEKRKEITNLYRKLLENIPGITTSKDIEGVKYNYPYFVIRVDKKEYGLSRDELYEELKKYNVISRKYFYPLCSNFQCYRDIPSASVSRLPVANKIAEMVLALPLHGRMLNSDVENICSIIQSIRSSIL